MFPIRPLNRKHFRSKPWWRGLTIWDIWGHFESSIDHLKLDLLVLYPSLSHITGSWYTYPSENMKVKWDEIPNRWKNPNVPNHQPD